MGRLALFLAILLVPVAAMAQSTPVPVTPGPLVPHNPDVATVTTGGTAVVAFNAYHVAKGGWIQNPSTATAPLCISQTGTAASTAAADATGGTTCIAPGQPYQIAPGWGAVSVNSTDSGHAFSGQGFY